MLRAFALNMCFSRKDKLRFVNNYIHVGLILMTFPVASIFLQISSVFVITILKSVCLFQNKKSNQVSLLFFQIFSLKLYEC